MNLWELTAPCHFGTEAVLKREILDLGYEVTRVEDGRVTFEADAQGVADAKSVPSYHRTCASENRRSKGRDF